MPGTRYAHQGAGHPETITWDEHREALQLLEAELSAEIMHLEALLDRRNREIDSLVERLPAEALERRGRIAPPGRHPLPGQETPPPVAPAPAADSRKAAAAAGALAASGPARGRGAAVR